MKLIKFLFAFIPAISLAASPSMVKEVRARENFRVTWKYTKPVSIAEKYRVEILNRKIASFSNLLDGILSRADTPRINVMILPPAPMDGHSAPARKNGFDSKRKSVFIESGDDFNIKKSLDIIVSGLGLSADYSGVRDYFGRPVPLNGGFLTFFQMNGKFYLTVEKEGKSSLLLEETEYFNSIKAAGRDYAAYRLRNSLWFVNIKRKKNFRYYTTESSPDNGWSGEIFLKTFDSDGKLCAVVVTSGKKSHILHGNLSAAPEILFADLPYSIDEIYITGDKIIFSARTEKDKTIIGVASAGQKKIFRLYSITEKFIVMGKYSGGIILFYPKSGKITFLDGQRQSVLTSDIKVKQIRDEDGIKYLIAPVEDELGDDVKKTLLENYSPRVVYLRDVNHLNFLYKKLSSSDYCAVYPLSGDKCMLLEKDGYTRKFKKYTIRGLLSADRLLFENNNRRRKYALAMSAFLVVLIVIAQGVINVKKKQKSE